MDDRARGNFARRYQPAVEAYFSTRWPAAPMAAQTERAVREVFDECFKHGEDLKDTVSDHDADFRRFLYKMAGLVSARAETKKSERFDGDESTLADAFDRAWARVLMRQAATQHAQNVKDDPAAVRRLELLRLRYYGGMQLDSIANIWHAERDDIEDQYQTARSEFETALMEVASYHMPRPKQEVADECERLLSILASWEKQS
jgi:hypothetical protein